MSEKRVAGSLRAENSRLFLSFSFIVGALLALASHHAHAQYRAEASLDKVDKEGFYQIPLTAPITALLSADYANLRLYDDKGVEVPYLIRRETQADQMVFSPFPIASNRSLKDSCTIIVLSNEAQVTVSSISLQMRNAAVYKNAQLSGSDDGKNWYALKERFVLGGASNPEQTFDFTVVDFPLSNYKFFRIWIDDKEHEPLNVIAAGRYELKAGTTGYVALNASKISPAVLKEKHITRIDIVLGTAQVVDKISWKVKGLPFFFRDCTVFRQVTRKDKKGKTIEAFEFVASTSIHSEHEPAVYFDPVKTKTLRLEIMDGDNPPLEIEDVQVHQLQRHLIAWLQPGKNYKMKFGDERSMHVPQYDLASFQDKVPQVLPVLQVAAPVNIVDKDKSQPQPYFQSAIWIWITIGGAMIVLGFLSYKMLRGA